MQVKGLGGMRLEDQWTPRSKVIQMKAHGTFVALAENPFLGVFRFRQEATSPTLQEGG